MKIILSAATLVAVSTGSAFAISGGSVPEISSVGGVAAMAIVGGIAVYLWERKNRK